MPTEQQFHQNIYDKTGQQKSSIIGKLHKLPTNMVHYKYTEWFATVKPMCMNEQLCRNEPLCRNEAFD